MGALVGFEGHGVLVLAVAQLQLGSPLGGCGQAHPGQGAVRAEERQPGGAVGLDSQPAAHSPGLVHELEVLGLHDGPGLRRRGGHGGRGRRQPASQEPGCEAQYRRDYRRN